MSGAPAPAIGYSIVANLGGDHQMTVQCFVSEDETDSAVSAKIDRVFRVVDRQKARYELTDLAAELSKHREALAQFKEDLGKTDLLYEKKQAALDVQIVELHDRHKAENEARYSANRASGRTGEYQPKGIVKANLDRILAGVEAVKKEKQTAEAERNQHREGLMISVTRYEAAIAELEGKISSREALLKGD